jgi:hypothetical protein
MGHSQRVDKSPSSSLALCSCGWRSMGSNYASASAAARAHAIHAHSGEDCNSLHWRKG